MKKLIFLLAACLLVSFSFVSESEARPKHKRSHYTITKVQKKRVRVVRQAVNPQQVVQQPNYDDTPAAFFAAASETNTPAQVPYCRQLRNVSWLWLTCIA